MVSEGGKGGRSGRVPRLLLKILVPQIYVYVSIHRFVRTTAGFCIVGNVGTGGGTVSFWSYIYIVICKTRHTLPF